MISHQFVVTFQRIHVCNVPPHFLILNLRSAVKYEQQIECACKKIWTYVSQPRNPLKALKMSEAQDVIAQLGLEGTSLKSA